MTVLAWKEGRNEISNNSGVQVIGSKSPDLKGLSPKELLEGALALCISISLEKVLARDEMEVDLNEVHIEVKSLKAPNVTNRFTDFTATVQLPKGLEANYKKKILTVIERACTISNTLSAEATVELREVEEH